MKQQGFILVSALLFLFLIAVLTLAGISNTTTQERMNKNLNDKEHSFQAAETSLKMSENWLMGLTSEPIPKTTCTSHPCILILDPSLVIADKPMTWWLANSAILTGVAIPNVIALPRYRVEFVQFIPNNNTIGKGVPKGNYYYQLTATSNGSSTEAQSVVRSVVVRPF